MAFKSVYDLVVIGGGINGVGIARDAAGRGLSVLLVEQGDLAQATSSNSTKLIHGGLRYLEQYDFKLVRESLNERERLLRGASHIMWPQEFVIPHEPHLRPAWMIRAGLFLYDYLGKRELLPGSGGVDFRTDARGKPLKTDYVRGFSYFDCWVDDARLVVLCAKDAEERGADIAVRTACTGLKAEGDVWRVSLGDKDVQARAVVNAAGPWVRTFLDEQGLAAGKTPGMRYSKGSHIIVKQLYDGEHAYLLQQPDGRIVFTIPYEGDFTLIGTTDTDYRGDPMDAEIDEDEVDYLCAAAGRSFVQDISLDDVVWAYSGVRGLPDSGEESLSEVSRDYILDLDKRFDAPLLNVFGGKLTTFRKLSEQVVNRLSPYFDGMGEAWTRETLLPGGDIAGGDFEAFVEAQLQLNSLMDAGLVRRLCRAYGSRISSVLEDGLGHHLGDDVYEAELRYLIEEEWARTSDDILWRRSKLGLHLSHEVRKAVEARVPELVREMGYD